MKLISEITSLVLVLYVFACLVDGFQMRRDRQIMRAGVCVGFMAIAGLLLSTVTSAAFLVNPRAALGEAYNMVALAIPLLALLASYFVVSQRAAQTFVSFAIALTAMTILVFQPIAVLRLNIPGMNFLPLVLHVLTAVLGLALAKSGWFLANIRILATFVCANYIVSAVLGYVVKKLVPMPKLPDVNESFFYWSAGATYVSAIAAWFIAQAIARRFEPQTSSVTSEA